MKTKKKISLMVTVILLLQIILPMLTVLWENGFTIKSMAAETYEATVDGITWTYEVDEQNNAINVKPKDKSNLPKEVAIPSALNGHTVISIGEKAFYYCKSLENINIPISVISIENLAFAGCELTSVKIPEGVISIGYSAFSDCNRLTKIEVSKENKNYSSEEGVLFNKEKTELIKYPVKNSKTDYIIPDSVLTIGYSAFSGCENLTNISIPNSVSTIRSQAFRKCVNLMKIEIPESVINIDLYVFNECTNLTEINVDPNNKNYSSEEGVLFNKEKTELINYPAKNQRTNYIIPKSVTNIKYYSFYNCNNLININIPEGITRIEDYTFYGCNNLANVTIPEGVEIIGRHAFDCCSGLKSIEIPNSVTSIGYGAFARCSSLAKIDIPEEVTTIGSDAFFSCISLTSINVNEGNKYYISENGVLYNLEKTELIQYPAKKIDTEYNIPSEVTEIKEYAFYGCHNLTIIKIPNSVTNIGHDTFMNCRNLTIICNDDAKAKEYAVNNDIPYLFIGDTNKDDSIDFMDILAINKHRLGKAQLTGAYLEAADVNGDNKVDFMDILQINKYRLGKIDSL